MDNYVHHTPSEYTPPPRVMRDDLPCFCQGPSEQRESKKERSAGRKYVTCARRFYVPRLDKYVSGCNFFKWVKEEPESKCETGQ